MKKRLYEIWMEFWFIRVGANGSTEYRATWGKLWSQLSQVSFFYCLYLKIFTVYSAYISDTVIITLAGQAIASMGWYQWGKQSERKQGILNISGAMPQTVNSKINLAEID